MGSGAVNDRAGLSPRVRGNLQVPEGVVDAFRSIPARAGEPTRPFTTSMVRRVYPRACGGTWVVGAVLKMGEGLSPRVRGNLHGQRCGGCGAGSIPARAGEPSKPARHLGHRWVYPRACGGTHGPAGRGRLAGGLSPRVRGNPADTVSRSECRRSIPARAGEPVAQRTSVHQGWVYPRACGGTDYRVSIDRDVAGLSPRVRGNPPPW